jgi:DNA-binding LacI/PurR family transcriptional regulator
VLKNNPITIKDLAKLLGVSKSTVSRALKDHPDISPGTKEAVKSLATSFNYRPSQVAISLRLGKSKVIGLIIPKIYSFFFPSVVNGIEHVVHQHGYNLMILQSNELYQNEVDNTNILLDNNVEGILASVSRQTKNLDHFQNALRSNIPIVFFDRVPKDLHSDMVLIDDIKGAYNAVKHLIDRGRRKIAICIGNPDLLISINRLRGYKMALEEMNLSFREEYVVSAESPELAAEATATALDLPDPPDSIFAISDLTMSGIVREIYKRKIKVPDQIALIGFCEDTFCLMYNPQLTSIMPMGFEIGKAATERLFMRIYSEDHRKIEPETIHINGQLVVRDST